MYRKHFNCDNIYVQTTLIKICAQLNACQSLQKACSEHIARMQQALCACSEHVGPRQYSPMLATARSAGVRRKGKKVRAKDRCS